MKIELQNLDGNGVKVDNVSSDLPIRITLPNGSVYEISANDDTLAVLKLGAMSRMAVFPKAANVVHIKDINR